MKNYLSFCFVLYFAIISFAQENINEDVQKDSQESSLESVRENIQENASSKEAGAYQRKSVAFLNLVINKKGGSIDAQMEKDLISVLQGSVKFERFDYNNIPQNIVNNFSVLPSSLSVEERMNQTIVPAILAAVDAQKEMRAINLLSEQQKNSFITDKAKELGITEDELNTVMNSAFIFVPVYLGHADTSFATENGTGYKFVLAAGGYWWKIDNVGEKPTVNLIAHIERTTSSTKFSNEQYYVNGQKVNYKYAAFRSALNAIATDIETATKEIPDFQLSAQILNKNPRNVVISIGNREGVKTDDKFWVYDSHEDTEGNITQKKHGWVMIKKVGEKAHGLDSTQSQAQIISGMPYIGSTIKEIPHLPIDMVIGFGMSPLSIDTTDITKNNAEVQITNLSNMYGPELKANINLLSAKDVSQFWLGIGAKALWGSAKGKFEYLFYNYEIDYSFAGEYDISLMKKIFIRRFILAPEIAFGVKNIMIFGEDKNVSNNILSYDSGYKRGRISQWQIGVLANMGIEFALAPIVHIGGSAGWHAFLRNNQWDFSHKGSTDKDWKDESAIESYNDLKASGLTWSGYITFTVPHGSKKNKDSAQNKERSGGVNFWKLLF